MKQHTIWVGIDDHKMSVSVAVLDGNSEADPVIKKLANEDGALRRWVRRLERQYRDHEIRVCYEAGPNGFSLKRRLESFGSVTVEVMAPSLTPRRAGQRVKTDKRDASKLAHLYRSGELSAIATPNETDESARDLGRTFQQVKQEILRKRHHLLKFMTRRGRIYRDGQNWTLKHRQWLKSRTWAEWADEESFGELLTGLRELEDRRLRLEQALQRLAAEESRSLLVGVLRCFHGIDTTAAVILVNEIFEIERFKTPRRLLRYLGLTSGVDQSGDRERRGGITKTGNRFVRFTLGQIAWHYRHRPSVGMKLKKRREGQPLWAIAIADRAHQRLCRRYWALVNRGKPTHKDVTAVARELVGFMWEALMEAKQQSSAVRSVAA
jgi:transposase